MPHDHVWNHHLALRFVALQQFGEHNFATINNHNRHHRNCQVHKTRKIRAISGSFFGFCGHNALKNVLLRNRTKSDRHPRRNIRHDFFKRRIWQNAELFGFRCRRFEQHIHAADLLNRVHHDQKHPDNNHQRLDKIRDRHCPHTADIGVKHHNCGANNDAPKNGNCRQNVQNRRQSNQLCRNPTPIRRNHHQSRNGFRAVTVTLPKIIAKGQKIEAIQRSRHKNTDQNQAQRRAQRVFNDAHYALIQKRRRRAHDGFGAKPRRKKPRRHDHHRHPTPRNHKIGRVFDEPRRPPTNADREQHI